jgi:hypothetical protein
LLGQRNKKSDEKKDLNVRDDAVMTREGKSFPTVPYPSQEDACGP